MPSAPREAHPSTESAYLNGRQLRRLIGWGSVALIVVLILSGAATVAGYLVLPAIILTVLAPRLVRHDH